MHCGQLGLCTVNVPVAVYCMMHGVMVRLSIKYTFTPCISDRPFPVSFLAAGTMSTFATAPLGSVDIMYMGQCILQLLVARGIGIVGLI